MKASVNQICSSIRFAVIDRLACLAFIVIVLTTALVIAYRRDQRTAAHCLARPNCSLGALPGNMRGLLGVRQREGTDVLSNSVT